VDAPRHAGLAPLLAAVLVGLAALLVSPAARAHKVGVSRGEYTLRGRALVAELTFEKGELAGAAPGADQDRDGELSAAELGPGKAAIGEALIGHIRAEGDGARCEGSIVEARPTEGDGVQVSLLFACPAAPRKLTLDLDFFGLLAHGHRHLGTLTSGEHVVDLVAFASNRSFSIEGGQGGGPPAPPSHQNAGAGALFKMGIEHILTGYDHLVFLLGLVLIGGRLRSILAVVTAFTLAHSITLGLAALGLVTLSPRLVEPAIALSIVYVGIENFFVASAEKRWRITFPFGLIHGFGFAGALAEIELPRAKVPLALLLFNLGVETGQLAVLALLLPVLAWLRKQDWFARHGVRVISGAIIAAGLGWFVERVFFP
jgi:hydrogenase/urease accessory protein HupE